MARKKDKTSGKKKNALNKIEPIQKFKVNYYLGFLLLVIAFLLYFNSIDNGYVLDDYHAITVNRFVQEGIAGIPELLTIDFWHFSNIRLGYYRPLPLITYAIEYEFFGLSSTAGHFDNVLLFSISVFLVFLFLSKLFSGFNPLFPFIATLLFAIHPIHTEVVDNIKGRDELLSFLNVIAMLYFAIRYLEDKKTGYLILSIFLFYLALLSKESAIIGIVFIPLVMYYLGYKSFPDIIKKTLPFTIALLFFYIQKQLLFEATDPVIPNDIVNYPYRDEVVKYSSTFMLFLFYLRILIFPHPLRYDYSYNHIPAVGWDNIWALIGFVVFIMLIIYGFLQVKKTTRLGFALWFFLIALIPAMSFTILRGGIFAERLLFAPSLGFCIALSILFEKITHTSFTKPLNLDSSSLRSILLLFPLVLVVSVLYTIKTFERNKVWKDEPTLYSTDIKTGANSAQNQLHFGSNFLREASVENDSVKRNEYLKKGLSALHQATRIYPEFGDAYYWKGYVYELRASHNFSSALFDSALYYFNLSLKFAPGFNMTYYHLGNLYEWIGRYDVASYNYNIAYKINPEFVPVITKVKEMKEKRGLDVRINPLIQEINKKQLKPDIKLY